MQDGGPCGSPHQYRTEPSSLPHSSSRIARELALEEGSVEQLCCHTNATDVGLATSPVCFLNGFCLCENSKYFHENKKSCAPHPRVSEREGTGKRSAKKHMYSYEGQNAVIFVSPFLVSLRVD